MKRKALITGANRGIGLAIARELAADENIDVIACARNKDDIKQMLFETGGNTTGVPLDLSSPLNLAPSVKQIESDFGPIDILVNNAAILTEGDGLDLDVSALAESVEINVLSPYVLIKELGKGMKERGWGRIVNVSSGYGSFGEGLNGPIAYASTKAMLNAVTVKFSQELGSSVKVNAACPGWVRTRMGGSSAPRSVEQGADTPIWLATLPEDGPTGGFFRDRKPIKW